MHIGFPFVVHGPQIVFLVLLLQEYCFLNTVLCIQMNMILPLDIAVVMFEWNVDAFSLASAYFKVCMCLHYWEHCTSVFCKFNTHTCKQQHQYINSFVNFCV